MIRRINLLPEELRPVNKRGFYFIAFSSSIVYIIVLCLITLNQGATVKTLRSRMETGQKRMTVMSAQNTKYKEVIDKINLTDSKKKEMEKRISLVKTLSSGRVLWSEYLYEIANITPYGVWMTGISSADEAKGDGKVKRIKINGMALSSGLISDFMSAVDSSPHFGSVALVSAQNTDYQGREAYSFEITFGSEGM